MKYERSKHTHRVYLAPESVISVSTRTNSAKLVNRKELVER